MTEHQAQMALGQLITPRGDIIGQHLVEFDDQGHPQLLTFENGKTTKIVDESQ